MKIAYLIRAGFGVIGGAASYMFPVSTSKHHDVLVLETRNPKSNGTEPVVYHDESMAVIDIQDVTRKKRMHNALDRLYQFNPDILMQSKTRSIIIPESLRPWRRC